MVGHFYGDVPTPCWESPPQAWPEQEELLSLGRSKRRKHGPSWLIEVVRDRKIMVMAVTGKEVNELELKSAGSTVAERLAHSPLTKANWVQSPAGSPDFLKWESCQTMPLVGGFPRGYNDHTNMPI
ncbi:hypothetical protein PR048_020502 [Dryococelus australis]|uniref:Uncharacterized protein n=1 Tax=Dryococelus australis TaxID=614101 RepID=A0ABQ9H6K4_9NEOP|nr:hypothetical protein PR048_020502 [Dryococelus australis]